MTNSLSVSIVLYNTERDDIFKCLRSLERYSALVQIYVIDNSPTNALEACFRPANVIYTHLPSNPGFGAAHNVGLAASQAAGFSYHLVLNADVSFETDVLTPMLAHMAAHPQVGQMMPRVDNADGSIQRLCKLVPTPADLLFRRFLPRRLKDANNRRFELHNSGYDRVMFVPYLSGCFMLLRNSAIAEIGGFDERFFLYPEDIDLTRRMAERYDTIYFPAVSVTHQHGAASYKSLKMLGIHLANLARYFNKWGWVRDPVRDRLNARTLAQFDPLATLGSTSSFAAEPPKFT
jgi:GT2 family glycosyltransferase